MSPRLIIVSNRVVAPEEADSSLADELAATVKAALKNQNGMWFGWSGKLTENPRSQQSNLCPDRPVEQRHPGILQRTRQ
jgi:trehalose-6-phosphate synthase